MAKGVEISMYLTAYDKASRVINNFATKNQAKLAAFSKRTSELGDKAFDFGKKAGITGLLIGAPLLASAHAAEEAEVANRRLANVFAQMGDKSGEAARLSSEYASKLQMQIGIEDEVIMAAQAKIATFKHVSSETARMAGVFDRATEAAFDMQAAGFGDAAQNAVQLGKALESPTQGINALRRSGITFTDQERKKIAQLERSGQILKAQKIILAAVETQVKGTAAATATQGQKTKIALGEIMESAGKAFLPMMNQVLNKIAQVSQRVIAWMDKNPKLAKTILMIVAGAAALSLAVSALSFSFGGLMKAVSFTSNTFGFFFKLLKAVTYQNAAATIQTKLATASTVFQGIATKIASGTMAAFKFVMMAVNAVMAMNPFVLIAIAVVAVSVLIYKNWDKIKAFFIALWDKIKTVFSNAWNFVKNLFFKYDPVGIIIKNWDKIKGFFGNLWEGIKGKFLGFFEFLWKLPARMFEGGKNLIKAVWEGIKSYIHKPIELIKTMVKKIRDFLPFSPAKEGALRDIHRIRLVETISENIKPRPMVEAMRRTTAAAMLASQTVLANPTIGPAAASSAGQSIVNNGGVTLHYAPVITLPSNIDAGTQESFDKMLQDHSSQIIRILENYQRRNDRLRY